MSSSTPGGIQCATPCLPPYDKNKSFRVSECQQVLACTELEYELLRQQVKSIGSEPRFDGKALLDQRLRAFDRGGTHRARLWGEVERSDPLFTELFSGSRQNCSPSTWQRYLGKVQNSMLLPLCATSRRSGCTYSDDSEQGESTENAASHDGQPPSIPSKRSSGDEDLDFGFPSRPPRKRISTNKALYRDEDFSDEDESSADSGVASDEDDNVVASRKSKPLKKQNCVSSAPSPLFESSSPLPERAALSAEEDELAIDNRSPSVASSSRYGQSNTLSVGLEFQQLFNQRLDERTAAMRAAFDEEDAAERERLKTDYEARRVKDRHKLNAAHKKKYDANLAACKQEYESVINEREVQSTAEKTRLESIIGRKEAQIAAEIEKYEADLMEKDAQIVGLNTKYNDGNKQKEAQFAAEKMKLESVINDKDAQITALNNKYDNEVKENDAEFAALIEMCKAEIQEKDAQLADQKQKYEAENEEKEIQRAAEKTQYQVDIKAEFEAQMAIERAQIDSVVEEKVQRGVKAKLMETAQSM